MLRRKGEARRTESDEYSSSCVCVGFRLPLIRSESELYIWSEWLLCIAEIVADFFIVKLLPKHQCHKFRLSDPRLKFRLF